MMHIKDPARWKCIHPQSFYNPPTTEQLSDYMCDTASKYTLI